MVIDDGVIVPSHAPVPPAPSKTREGGDADSNSKGDPHSTPDNPWRRSPIEARIHRNRHAVNRPRVIDWNVNHRRVGWRDHNQAIIDVHRQLRRAVQLSSGLRLLAHRLHCIHYVLRLVEISIAQIRGPLNVLVHLCQNRRKRRQRLYARVPAVGICRGSNLICRSIALRLPPLISFRHLVRISGPGQNLRHQGIGIERDGRY